MINASTINKDIMLSTPDWSVPQSSRIKYAQIFHNNDPGRTGFISGPQAKVILLQSGLHQKILAQIWGLADCDADGRLTVEEFILANHLIDCVRKCETLPATLPVDLIPPSQRVVKPLSSSSSSSSLSSSMSSLAMVSNSANMMTSAIGKGMPSMISGTSNLPSSSPLSFQQSSAISTNTTLPCQSPIIMGDSNKLQRSGSLSGPSFSPSMMLTEWAIPQPSKLKYTQIFNQSDRTRTGFLTGPQARNILIQSGVPQKILAQIWNLADVDADGLLTCEEFVLAMHLIDCVKSGEPLPSVLPQDLLPPSQRRRRSSSGSTPSLMTAQTASVDLINSTEEGLLLSDNRKGSMATFEDKRRENFEKGQAELERRRQMLQEQQRREKDERERKEREEHEKREKIRIEQERRRQQELERQIQKQRELEAEKEEQRKRQLGQREAARREMERQRLIEWENQRKQEMMTQKQRIQESIAQLKSKKKNLVIEFEKVCNQVDQLQEQVDDTRKNVAESKSDIDKMRGERDVKLKEINFLKTQMKTLQDRQLLVEQDKINLSTQLKDISLTDVEGVSDSAKFALQNKQIRINQLKAQIEDTENEKDAKKKDVESNNAHLKDLRDEFDNLINKTKRLQDDYEKRLEQARFIIEENQAVQDKPFSAAWDDKTNEWPVEAVVPEVESKQSNQYRVLYKFEARNPDELNLEVGDIITVIQDPNAEPGWLQGENNGQIGWFPQAYVEPLESEEQKFSSIQDSQLDTFHKETNNIEKNGFEQQNFDMFEINTAPHTNTTESNILSTSQQPKSLDDGYTIINDVDSMVALYPWKSSEDNNLSFSKGDMISVRERKDPWWLGECNGQLGWFPKDYVKSASSVSELEPNFYIALYQFQSEEPGDLPFEVGEPIKVVKKDGNWWTGEIEPNRSGIFPSNYVREAGPEELPKPSKPAPSLPTYDKTDNKKDVESSARPGSIEASPRRSFDSPRLKKIKKPDVVRVIASYKATGPEQLDLEKGQLIQVRKKNPSGWWEGEIQLRGKKRQIGWFPASYVKSLSASGPGSGESSARSTPDPTRNENEPIEKVITLYPFKAQHEDELTFRENEIIKVLSRQDPTWWKGQLESDGLIGLFPSNYVQSLKDHDNRWSSQPKVNNEDPEYHEYYEISGDNQLPQTHVASQVDYQRLNPILELIDTEANYVKDLKIVIDVFEKPLRKANVLSEAALNTIFLNWSSILDYNQKFLTALRERQLYYRQEGEDCIEMVGDILCDFLPAMVDIYIGFCSKQLKAAKLLQKKTENDDHFREFSKKLSSTSKTNGLPLGAYLLKPMQRITKYPLLVNKILSKTPIGHIDQEPCEKAYILAQNLCDQVNEACRNQENEERLEWIQSHVKCQGIDQLIYFNSSTKFMGQRRLLFSGFLIKVNSGKEILAFVFNDFLLLSVPLQTIGKFNSLWACDRAMTSQYRIYKKPILLSDLEIIDGSSSPSSGIGSAGSSSSSSSTVFNRYSSSSPPPSVVPIVNQDQSNFIVRLKTLERSIEFRANSPNDRNNWVQALTLAKADYLHNSDKRRNSFINVPKCDVVSGGFGRLLVTILEALQLATKNQALNSYCRVSLGDKHVEESSHRQVTQTKVARCCFPISESAAETKGQPLALFNATWNYSMQFMLREAMDNMCLCICCYDEDPFAPDLLLGQTVIHLDELADEIRNTPSRPLKKAFKLKESNQLGKSGTNPIIYLKLDLILFDG